MRSLLMAGLCLSALGACMQPPQQTVDAYSPPGETTEMAETRVMGSLTYRQRIALPQDAIATISVYRAGETGEGGDPVRQESFALNGRQVPVPFQIVIAGEDAGAVYTLDAAIRTADGELLWTSEPVQAFAADGVDEEIGMVMMVPAGRTRVVQEDITGRDWLVAGLEGQPVLSASRITMNFGADGRISGNASCNAFTGSYKINNSQIYIGPLALTRKACVPPLMEQERAFIDLLEKVSQLQIDESGTLTISGADGETLTAR